jgi:predicted RND superfamily exporter protein
MQQSYIDAGIYSAIAVVLLLLVDLRDLRLMILAALPLVLGITQLFGLMGLLGIPLNPANAIVLPLILGIGIDNGVHVVHDFRRHRGGGYRLSSSTALAIVMTSLTTMIGFGCLMIASHRGLESLGRVLTLSMTCCLFSSFVILPALLTWMSDRGFMVESEDKEEPTRSLPLDSRLLPQHRRDAAHLAHEPAPGAPYSDRLIEPRRRAA